MINVINGKRTTEIKDWDVEIVLYVPNELVADVGVLPKVKNLRYIPTADEEHPKEFKGKIVKVFSNVKEVSSEVVKFGNVIIKLVESFIRNKVHDDDVIHKNVDLLKRTLEDVDEFVGVDRWRNFSNEYGKFMRDVK